MAYWDLKFVSLVYSTFSYGYDCAENCLSLTCLHVALLLQDDRKTLPVYPYRDELLQAVNDHQVCLIDCWHFGCNNLEPIRYGCPYIFITLIGCESRFSLLLEKLVLERLLRYLNIFMRQAIPSGERWIAIAINSRLSLFIPFKIFIWDCTLWFVSKSKQALLTSA